MPKNVVEHIDENIEEYYDESYQSPPDIALASFAYLDPKMLDEALRGPDAKHWQEALEYEISQLEKLGTWEVVSVRLQTIETNRRQSKFKRFQVIESDEE